MGTQEKNIFLLFSERPPDGLDESRLMPSISRLALLKAVRSNRG